MLTVGIVLLVIGVVACGGAFIFAAMNIQRFSKNSDTFDMGEVAFYKKRNGFGGFFNRHIGATVIMALGGLVSSVGVVLIIVSFIQILSS